ncbi:glycosyl hydrolase family 28-related protein [Sphingomonas sp. I4]
MPPAPPQAPGINAVSVLDFGAVGDGQTDDSAAVQRAYDTLVQRGGGRLYFPTGRYRIALVLTARSVHLSGTGASSSILIPASADAAAVTALYRNGAIAPVSIHDLGFRGSRRCRFPVFCGRDTLRLECRIFRRDAFRPLCLCRGHALHRTAVRLHRSATRSMPVRSRGLPYPCHHARRTGRRRPDAWWLSGRSSVLAQQFRKSDAVRRQSGRRQRADHARAEHRRKRSRVRSLFSAISWLARARYRHPRPVERGHRNGTEPDHRAGSPSRRPISLRRPGNAHHPDRE